MKARCRQKATLGVFSVLLGAHSQACNVPAKPGNPDEQIGAPGTTGPAFDDRRWELNNIIGRWYPSAEVKRFRDESLTPQEWCEREPMRIAILADSVEVRCLGSEVYFAALARVRTTTAGETILQLRTSRDSPLRDVRFTSVQGAKAMIAGLPCFGGQPEPHERFPQFEILTRQVLGGRRCSQLETPSEKAPGVP